MLDKTKHGGLLPAKPGTSSLRALISEDNPRDAKLAASVLETAGFAVHYDLTDSLEIFRERLATTDYDVILADYNLRDWTAMDALEALKQSGKDIPLIVVTGSLGDEAAVECIQRGASDFVLKDRPARLPAAVQRALEQTRLRTENLQAQQALRASEEKYRSLVSNIPDVVWTVDAQLNFTFISKNIEQLSGFSADEIYQHGVQLYLASLHPEDADKVKEGFRALFAEGRPFDVECRVKRKDGKWIWVYNRAHATYEKDGIRYADGLLSDITERKRSEAAVWESESRYRTLFERNLAGIVQTSSDGHIVNCNDEYARIIGFASRAQAVRRSVRDIWWDPAERESLLSRVQKEGTLRNLELRLRRRDGTSIWVLQNITWVEPGDGNEPLFETTLVNITERKRAEEELRISEERWRALFESSAIGIALTDPLTTRFHSANFAFQKMLGYSQEELRGLSFIDLTYEDDRERNRQLLAELLEGRWKSFEMQKRYRRKDGSLIWTNIHVSIVGGTDGNPQLSCAVIEDITERKRAEQALRRSEAILAAGERLTHTGSWSWNILIGELYWSDEAYRIFGFDPATDRASVRDTFLARIHPDDRKDVEEGLANPQMQSVKDYRVVLPDGSIRYIHDIAYPVTDSSGAAVERFGVASDVTERKRTEAALRESEERFRQIAETIDEVFWMADPHIAKMIYVSPAYERVWGRSCASLYENPQSFLESIHPDDRERVLAVLASQKTGQPFDHEYRIVVPDGTVRWIWDRGFPVRNDAGQVYRYAGVAVDITERKQAEDERARLVAAIEQSDEAVVMTNPAGDIEYVNPAFTWITGYSREEALGQNPRILKSDRQDRLFYDEIWATILNGKTWKGELINRRKDGTLYTEQMAITPVRNARGEITHFISTKQDVTERRALEAQLQQTAKIEAVGRLAGGVAHDFNNLLTVINGYSEIVLDMLGSEHKASTYLAEIKSAGDRAASLTRQLLAFSRRQVLAPQVLNLNAVISDVEKMLRRLIGEDVKLRVALNPALERVKADPGQIEQVIMNLAVNARDAMPSGGNLTIETANVELDESYARTHVTVKPGPHVMLAVGDTGVGMTPETQARIFEPFFTTKAMGHGTGLGLATVYGIVKQSGGSIWVYSELGRGTVFKIYLPTVGEAPAAEGHPMKDKKSASGSETILVIEDEEGVRSLIRLALVSGGYKVLVTEDAEKALAMCASHEGPIHLVLTDVVMPKMSGPAVAEKVSALRPGVKVLFMSGYTDDAIVHHGVLSEGVPFIQKPFSPVSLRQKVREVLDRQ